MKKSRTREPRHLQYEPLEPRKVMAGVTAALSGGGLYVYGTDAADQVDIQQTNGFISINGVTGSWSAKTVKSIWVDLKDGDDTVSVNSWANGGNQWLKEAIIVKSGGGNEHVQLASSHDVYFSGHGHTLNVALTGAASLDGVGLNLNNYAVASFKSGVLTITGTNGGDNFAVRQNNGYISVGNVYGAWAAKKVKWIIINLQDGNDSVSLDSLANGGNQAVGATIMIRSGAGNETVHLANGHDVTFSGLGHTLVVYANGAATLDGQTLSWNDPTPDPNPPATNWFDTHIQDAALRSLGSTLYVDGLINRADIMALFQSAQDGGLVDATEIGDFTAIVNNSSLFGALEHVWKLSSYIVMGNTANAHYQGQLLGNLTVGATASHLGNLVNKWFLGLDRPNAYDPQHPSLFVSYRQMAGTLFVNGAAYTDVYQGVVGDCYLMTSLAEVALKNPSTITNMFIVNGDGTYTVRFYNGSQTHYVTVDSYLPTSAAGNLIYAGMGANYLNSSNELWVGLAEKAYVQLNEMGWVPAGTGLNAYAAIDGGYISDALSQITGQATTFTWTSSSTSFTVFVTAYTQGKSIGFASYVNPPAGSGVVGSHAYAVVGYNASNQTVVLFNPWGIHYGLLTLSWSQVQASFQYFDRTV